MYQEWFELFNKIKEEGKSNVWKEAGRCLNIRIKKQEACGK